MIKKQQVWILLLYCIPYIYLATVVGIYGNGIPGFIILLMPLGQLALCSYYAHLWRYPWLTIPGNILSFLSSYYLIMTHPGEQWHAGFKPFLETSYTIGYTLVAIGVQLMVLHLCRVYIPNTKEDKTVG